MHFGVAKGEDSYYTTKILCIGNYFLLISITYPTYCLLAVDWIPLNSYTCNVKYLQLPFLPRSCVSLFFIIKLLVKVMYVLRLNLLCSWIYIITITCLFIHGHRDTRLHFTTVIILKYGTLQYCWNYQLYPSYANGINMQNTFQKILIAKCTKADWVTLTYITEMCKSQFFLYC